MSTKSELLPTPTPLRSDVDGGGGGGTTDEPNVFDMRARSHLAGGGKETPAGDLLTPGVDLMTPRTLLNSVANADLAPPEGVRRGNVGARSSARRQPLPLGSGNEAPESAGMRGDVLMPAMPRTMSTGLDLLRMAQAQHNVGQAGNGAAAAVEPFVIPSLPGMQPRQPPNSVAASLLSLSSGSSPVVSAMSEYDLGIIRTATPTQDAAAGGVAGAPALPLVSAPLMTPSYFLADMTPGVPPPGDVLPAHYQKTDEAAVLLHQLRKGVRTPTPTSSLAKEENVFERNLSILSKAPAVDSALVAPLPRHVRLQQQQQQQQQHDRGARPSDLMMPDPLLAGLPLGNVPAAAAAAARGGSAGKGKKRKAPPAAREPSPSPALDSMASDDDDDDDDGDDDDDDDDSPVPRKRKGQQEDEGILAKKKKRRREKCRIAATRFRQKKREEMRAMEETSTLLEQQNADLAAEMTQLRRKIMETKLFLMQHEKCLAAAQQQQHQQQH